MHSILAAFAWEFWKRTWSRSLLMLVIACGFMGLIRWAFAIGGMEVQEESLEQLCFVFLFIQWTVFGAVMLGASGEVEGKSLRMPRWLFTLPLSTARLVLLRMVIPATIIAFLSALSAGCFTLLFGAIPMIWICMFWIIGGTALFQTVIWLPTRNHLLKAAGFLIIVFFQMVYLRFLLEEALRDGNWMGKGIYLTIFAAICAFSYFAVLLGVRTDRRGDLLCLLPRAPGWRRMLNIVPMRTKPFPSPEAATFWGEWRQKGLTMPTAFLITLGVFVLIYFCAVFFGTDNETQKSMPAEDMLKGLFGICIWVPIIAAFPVGLIIGQRGRLKNPMPMGPFQATHPLTDQSLGLAILRVSGASIGLTYLLALAAAGFGTLWCSFAGSEMPTGAILRSALVLPPGISVAFVFLALGIAVVSTWILINFGVSMFLTGRSWISAVFFIGLCVSFFGVVFIAFAFPPDVVEKIRGGVGISFLALLLLGQGWLFYIARRRRMIPVWLIIVALVWLPTFIMLSSLKNWLYAQPDYQMLVLLLYAASLLPFLPFASVPLALSVNRHR